MLIPPNAGGSSREAQTAAPVDGFVPHAPTDGGDGVVVSMKSDGEGNILMPASVGDDGAELYWGELRYPSPWSSIQGDQAPCSKPPVDIDVKVGF